MNIKLTLHSNKPFTDWLYNGHNSVQLQSPPAKPSSIVHLIPVHITSRYYKHLQSHPHISSRCLRPIHQVPLRKTIPQQNSSLTFNMAILNVRSLLNKSFVINDLILDNNIDCLFLTETWLGVDTPVILTEASPPNFDWWFFIFHRGGKKRRWNCIDCSKLSFNKDSSLK